MQLIRSWFFVIFALLGGVISINSSAQIIPVMEFYYGQECPHCHEQRKWLPELLEAYPDLKVESYEVWHDDDNAQRWRERMAEFGMVPEAVPTNIIGNQVILGFVPEKITNALVEEYHFLPFKEAQAAAQEDEDELKDDTPVWQKYLTWKWPFMSFMLGLIDGFNPCAMWSLLVLLGALLSLKDSRKRWLIALVFIGVSGIMYTGIITAYLLGFSAITNSFLHSYIGIILKSVGVIAVMSGAFLLWESRKDPICEVRDQKQKQSFYKCLEEILQQKSLWLILGGVSLLAVSVNMVELLCSFAIPTTFVASLIDIGLPAVGKIFAVALYNIAYILDDVIVVIVVLKTLSLTTISPNFTRWMNIVGGLLMLIIGLLMLFNKLTILYL